MNPRTPARARPGHGSVYFDRSKGLYYAAVSVPGEGRQRKSRGFTSETLARIELNEMLLAAGLQATIPEGYVHLVDYLARWIDQRRVLGQIKPSTAAAYADQVRAHVATDLIGTISIEHITTPLLNDFVRRKLTTPSHRGQPLAPATLRSLLSIIQAAMRSAVREGLLNTNCVEAVDRPHGPEVDVPTGRTSPLSAEHYRLLQHAADTCRLGPLCLFCAATGLRLSEALGLERADVHLDHSVPHVFVHQQLQRLHAEDANHQLLYRLDGKPLIGWALRRPKSKKGVRIVGLPHDAQHAIARMLELVEREERAAADRDRFGQSRRPYGLVPDGQGGYCEPLWLGPPLGSGPPRSALVFCGEYGTPLNDKGVWHRFQRLLDQHGLPRAAVHALRHTNATLTSSGVPTALLQSHLGHARIEMTMRYAHDLDLERAAAVSAAFDQAVGGLA